MKKIKKIFALLMTVAMVMGLNVTAFAATKDTATITVENAEDATLKYVQVIEPGREAQYTTGWKFSSTDIANEYESALGVSDEQTAIAMLIKYYYESEEQTLPKGAPQIVQNASAATATQINQALDNVLNNSAINLTSMSSNSVNVNKAGVYVIYAYHKDYTFKPMSAYVRFGAPEEYDYPSLVDAKVVAKKIPTTITKKDNDLNNAVEIGQIVTYTVETNFPYFNKNDKNRYFAISDAIKGASYVGLTDDPDTTEVNEKTATVTIGTTEVTDQVEFVKNQDQNGESFLVNLTKFINDANTYAGQKVVVTYQADVTQSTVENKASSHVGDRHYDSDPINLYTGKITLLKYDVDNKNIVLGNAGFKVEDSEGERLTFVQKDVNKKIYTYDPEGAITEIFTDDKGNVVIEGLDVGEYTFTETTAPKGYSVNGTPVKVDLQITNPNQAGEATAIYDAKGEMADTKLTALPSTGGIGTTIFTIGGCVIMIAAAGLFFATRKKAEK